MTKDEMRKKVLAMRKRTPELMLKQRSGIICQTLTHTEEWEKARSIWTYISLPGEVETFTLIEKAWEAGKEVAVPKVEGDELSFRVIDDWSQVEEGYFHVLEPVDRRISFEEDALLVMPGVAFDLKCSRLGYGRGFYDRFLLDHPTHPTCALSFDFALFDEIPTDEKDRKPQMVITDKRILRVDNR